MWILFAPGSAMYKLPDTSKRMRHGYFNVALVAANPLVVLTRHDPGTPAKFVMMPVLMSTFRIRQLFVSLMYTFPEESKATPPGALNRALVAGPPSPVEPNTGDVEPAKVLMTVNSARVGVDVGAKVGFVGAYVGSVVGYGDGDVVATHCEYELVPA